MLEEFKKFIEEHAGTEEKFVDFVCSLIGNTSISYEDLFGATYVVHAKQFGDIIVEKKGMPVKTMMTIFNHISEENKKAKEESNKGKTNVGGLKR